MCHLCLHTSWRLASSLLLCLQTHFSTLSGALSYLPDAWLPYEVKLWGITFNPCVPFTPAAISGWMKGFLACFAGLLLVVLFCLSPTQLFAPIRLSQWHQLRPAESDLENPFARGAQGGNFGACTNTYTGWHHSSAAEKMQYTASAKCAFLISTVTIKLLRGEQWPSHTQPPSLVVAEGMCRASLARGRNFGNVAYFAQDTTVHCAWLFNIMVLGEFSTSWDKTLQQKLWYCCL